MATAGAQEASSSIYSTYQVFLSFRGKDTRKNFTAHLYTALVQAGIHTFRDDDELERGEDIQSELIKAIKQSRISAIVFSLDYASSKWCLDELLLILERRRTDKHIVFPIFYHVDPSQIRHQWGSVGESFARHEEKIKKETDYERKKELIDKVKRWRVALKEVADLSGMELKNQANGDEAKLIQKIVNMIQVKLSRKALNVAPGLIGIDSRTRNINLWLQDESSDVGIMVIYGMGNIGKTTIAKSVYNQNFERFAGCSFLSNIREMSEDPTGLIDLQSQLLSDICKRKKEKIFNVDQGIVKIKEAICCKRVLIILDDVDHVDQLYAIVDMGDWLFPGSKIIITTRRERLLKPYEPCKIDKVVYNKVEKLDHEESIKLFCLHAFGQNHAPEIFTMYAKRIAEHCEGIPLALQVLGSTLSGKNLDFWLCKLRKLEIIADNNIIKTLKISFDSLADDDIKNVFLHISCFFVGKEKDYVVKILDACDLHTVVGIDHLVDRGLLEIGYGNKLMMHQLVRDMGREIVRQESDEPGKRSRLWHQKDILSVLREKTGTRKLQALVFEMQNCMKDDSPPSTFGKKRGSEVLDNSFEWFRSLKRRALDLLPWRLVENNFTSSNEDELETSAFIKMQQLKLLNLSYAKLNGSYREFPKSLRWLCWHGFPLAFIPNDLSLENLVHLDMQYTSLRHVWKGVKFLPSLKILDLSHSKWLARTPDFRGAVSLERLILKHCVSLVEIDESIGFVERLSVLDLGNCRNLRRLPESSLRFLEKLEISGCSSLREFPMWMRDMDSLKEIYAQGIGTIKIFSPTRESHNGF